MTKIFCDIASIKLIKIFNKKKIVKGFTTNPSLMRKAGAKNYFKYSKEILKNCNNKPISFEVFADDSSLGTTTADSNGNWSFTVSSVLNDDTYVITATANAPNHNGVSNASNGLSIEIDTYYMDNRRALVNAISYWISNENDARAIYGDINTWDVSAITDFSSLFSNRTRFNSDISDWNVSNGIYFSSMFSGATAFDQNIGGWNVSSGESFSYMFSGATAFDQDISNWDVSNVAGMNWMFSGATNFTGDLSGWNVSSVTLADNMFNGAVSFDSDLSSWDVSSMTDMSSMFANASNFNSDVSNWDVSNVLNMEDMFLNANALSLENQCQVHESWSDQNDAWPYNWFGTCQPELTVIPDTSIHEDHEYHLNLSDFSVFPTESNGGYSYSSFTDTAHVMVEVDDHHLLVHPALHWNGIALVSVVVNNDSSNLADTSQFTLNVEAVNDAPEFENFAEDLSINEDVASTVTLNASDIDVAVESFYNVAEDDGASVTSSSAAGEFVKIDNSADIALGNGGDDTYVVGADSGIYGGVALEYGNIGVRGGLTGSIDAVNILSLIHI